VALNQEDVLTFIDMIEKRGEQVLAANEISPENDANQYQWIKGIYDDIIGYIKSQF
jgi:hypothetical protein